MSSDIAIAVSAEKMSVQIRVVKSSIHTLLNICGGSSFLPPIRYTLFPTASESTLAMQIYFTCQRSAY